MKHSSLEIASGAQLLSEAMRAIRKKRGLTVNEVAAAMDMARRTYEEFEAGRGPITHERIFAFAEATNSDPYALILSVDFQKPQFAIDCADTKLVLIIMIELHDFAKAEGEDIAYLDPNNIIGVTQRMFGDLSTVLADSDAFLKNWLDKRTGWIGLNSLRARGGKKGPRKR